MRECHQESLTATNFLFESKEGPVFLKFRHVWAAKDLSKHVQTEVFIQPYVGKLAAASLGTCIGKKLLNLRQSRCVNNF